MSEEISVNLMINNGDLLEDVEIWRIETRAQHVKLKSPRFLRPELLKIGLAHAFFEEFLWLCSVSGKNIDESIVENLANEYFKQHENIDTATITLTSDNFWLNIGIVLVRDAIQYALYNKFKDDKNFIVKPKRKVYKLEFVYSGLYAGAVRGISLNRIFRIGSGNICIAPIIIYECFDNFYRRIENPSERSRYISRASRIPPAKYERIVENLISRVTPLTVYLSDRKLLFKEWKYRVQDIDETGKRVHKQATLEKWFQ